MSRVGASAMVPGPAGAVRELWFDTSRWPAFVDGFGRVVRVEAGWPQTGRIVWDSTPHGRGRVVERITGDGVAEVEDAKLAGTQTVRFEPAEAGEVHVTVELDYRLKDRTVVTPLVDLLFVRRVVRDALARTVRRFAAEARLDADLRAGNLP